MVWARFTVISPPSQFAPFTYPPILEQGIPSPPPPGGCTWKIALKYKVKQSKNGKFTSNYKANPIDFETQISLRR